MDNLFPCFYLEIDEIFMIIFFLIHIFFLFPTPFWVENIHNYEYFPDNFKDKRPEMGSLGRVCVLCFNSFSINVPVPSKEKV